MIHVLPHTAYAGNTLCSWWKGPCDWNGVATAPLLRHWVTWMAASLIAVYCARFASYLTKRLSPTRLWFCVCYFLLPHKHDLPLAQVDTASVIIFYGVRRPHVLAVQLILQSFFLLLALFNDCTYQKTSFRLSGVDRRALELSLYSFHGFTIYILKWQKRIRYLFVCLSVRQSKWRCPFSYPWGYPADAVAFSLVERCFGFLRGIALMHTVRQIVAHRAHLLVCLGYYYCCCCCCRWMFSGARQTTPSSMSQDQGRPRTKSTSELSWTKTGQRKWLR